MAGRLMDRAWRVMASSSWGETVRRDPGSFMVFASISPRKYSPSSSQRRLMSLDSL